jgi:hypothetical protein
MNEKVIDIKERFSLELSNIDYILTNLENRRVQEITNVNSDGSLPHNIAKLRKEINGLLYKVQYGKESALEEMDNAFFKLK